MHVRVFLALKKRVIVLYIIHCYDYTPQFIWAQILNKDESICFVFHLEKALSHRQEG